MKKIRTKKLFALLLSAAMVISMLCIAPVSASAETSGDELSDKLYGDVNGDGKVNIKDATDIQRAAASIIELTDVQNVVADVNGDSKVNIKDATGIQKFAASLTVANVGEKVPTALLPEEVEEIPTYEVEL